MLFIQINKLELVGGHIGFMLFKKIEEIELTGGYIEVMLFTDIDKGESNSNISISINSIKTIWPPENRIFNSLSFWACWLSYI